MAVSPGAGVSASIDPVSGALVWNQSGNAAGSATPGVYNLTFSAPGYDSVGPIPVTVPLCWTSPCSAALGTISMSPHISIAVQPQYTAQTGLAGPTVTLTDQTTNKIYTEGLTGGTASFPDLSSSHTYTYSVAAPGFATYTCQAPTCSVSTVSPVNGVVTVQPPLSPLGYIVGTLVGQINGNGQTSSPLVGVQMEAVDQTTPSSCGSVPLTATTGTNGNFTISGDIAQGPGGLCPGDVYTVQLASAVPGYPFPASTMVTIAPVPPALPQFGTPASLTLQAQTVSFALYLVDDQSPTPMPVPTASVVASSAVAPSVTLTESTGPSGQAEYSSSSLFPTAYTFNIAEPGYAPLAVGPITFPAGYSQGTNINTYTLSANRTIRGTVVTPTAGTSSTAPLGAGVTVNLLDPSHGGAVIATATTVAGGSFSFSSLATGAPIPSGTYQLAAIRAGYTGSATASLHDHLDHHHAECHDHRQPGAGAGHGDVDRLFGQPLGHDGQAHQGRAPTTKPTVCTATSPTDVPQQSTIYGFGQGPSVPYSVTVNGGTASFVQVVPDYYELTVVPGASRPAQMAGFLYVCPDASGTGSDTYTSPAPTFQVQEGLITGTVSAATSIAAASVTVTATTAGTVTNPSVSCSGACLSGTYSEYVPLGDSYSVDISLAGYSPANSPSPPPVLSAGAADRHLRRHPHPPHPHRHGADRFGRHLSVQAGRRHGRAHIGSRHLPGQHHDQRGRERRGRRRAPRHLRRARRVGRSGDDDDNLHDDGVRGSGVRPDGQ